MIFIFRSINKAIETDLNLNTRKILFPIIKMGDIVYHDIISLQANIFNSHYFNGIKSKIYTSIIQQQFEADMLPNNFGFECSAIKINNFGEQIPELKRGNFIIDIVHGSDSKSLPSTSKYKKDKAKNNKIFGEQMMINIIEKDNKNIICDEKKIISVSTPYYALLIFGDKRELNFVNLIVPSYNFKEIICNFDLKQEFQSNSQEDTINIKKNRLKLRENITRKILEESI